MAKPLSPETQRALDLLAKPFWDAAIAAVEARLLKPRLRQERDGWRCYSATRSAVGVTAQEAWAKFHGD